MSLNYKATNIAKAERECDKSFFEAFDNLGGKSKVDDLLFIWKAGGGSEDEFDETFAKGINVVIVEVMKGVNEAGFLGQKLDVAELEKAMNQETAKASPNSGKATKA